jgi:hypothetical protein
MTYALLFTHLALCLWLLLFGGAKLLEGSFSTIFFFHPAMTVKELKFYAALSLIITPLYFL